MKYDVEQVRACFPSLHIPAASGQLPVFFDNPAGSQVPQTVIDAVRDYYLTMNAYPGGAFATSRRSEAMHYAARERMAALLNAASPEEIVFGPNMTTLSFALTRALGKTLSPGDEIVVTRMDHDGNIAPWLRIAEDRDLVIRWVDIHTEDCTLDMDGLEAALNERTRIVATAHASNAVGTINDAKQIAAMAHAAGALHVLDAVQSTPHVAIDVQDIGCDFLLCSAYKFCGPHIGTLWGRYDLLADLPAYKVRPAKDVPPFRFETGAPSFELLNGLTAAVDFLAWIGEQFGNAPDPAAGRRGLLVQAMHAVETYEQELGKHLIAGLQAIPGVTIAGITEPARAAERVPTVAFVLDGYTPRDVAEHLDRHDIYVWNGNYYAKEIMERLGRGEHGMVRVGPVHYNTIAEVDRLLDAVKLLAN
ncbi:cysteine desulfurase-like protein [Aggregatilinea lenta]|uniref:cysteine desulfurase-like protein n=1 Tax=Aggregatilinea lenta TaxID=913108 RepID=UPI000E5B1310|nr:cysteine desulfurase-like protein [Aggregatilinea lenta]